MRIRNDDRKIYYVYQLINPIDNKIFYIGYGKNKRISSHWKIFVREGWDVTSVAYNYYKYVILQQIYERNLQPIEQKIVENKSLQTVRILEEQLIKKYGKICDDTGILTNILDYEGQHFTSVKVLLDKYRQTCKTKVNKQNRIRGQDKEWIRLQKMHIAKSNWEKPEYRDNMVLLSKERWKDLDYIQLIKQRRIEMWTVEEYQQKISIKRKQMWKDPIYIEKKTGNFWINNGIIGKLVKIGTLLEDGWILGKLNHKKLVCYFKDNIDKHYFSSCERAAKDLVLGVNTIYENIRRNSFSNVLIFVRNKYAFAYEANKVNK
jgi:hypothetical protein